MIITAMYMYGMIQGAWGFQIGGVAIAFFMDLILVSAFGSDIGEHWRKK